MKIAILITVYNRKETTIKGLNHLHTLIKKDFNNKYDIYLTNDGCTDGTEIAVSNLYPHINIINHEGNLFWSRGMNLAWKTALQKDKYDYFIWFNDDAILYPNALNLLLKCATLNKNSIIVGAFNSKDGKVSYGGKNKKHQLISPNGLCQEIFYMNGNFVIIPFPVYQKIGLIDKIYTHGIGDYDYGLRAKKNGIKVLLTPEYVGETERHDYDLMPYFSNNYSLIKRFKILYSPKYSTIPRFKFLSRYSGVNKAIITFIYENICTLFPSIYSIRRRL